MRRGLPVIALLLIAAFAAGPAFGSAIIGHDVSHARLTIDRSGRAHVTYRVGGRTKVLTAWGAINARAPSRGVGQVEFRIRYGQRGNGVCLPYDGPPLAWMLAARKAPDGSYPYRGRGVYGFSATGHGAPLDSYGRNVYVDTFDSRYGKGWHRENSFLTHHRGKTLGDFCYGFFPHGSHPPGQGTKYRATVEGPGVTPDVMWTADDIGPFDESVQAAQQALERSWGDPKCRT